MAEDRTIKYERQYTCPACGKMRTEGAEHACDYQPVKSALDVALQIDPVSTINAIEREAARDKQVAGEHYRKFKIQPWDVIDEYGLSFYAGNALKYLLRAGNKGSKVEDLKKCRHYLDKLIELEADDGQA